MAFYLRKAFRLGPFRVNLSTRGPGASAGVTGARVGVDAPGAPYVHSGRAGLYSRGRGARIGWGAFVLAAVLGLLAQVGAALPAVAARRLHGPMKLTGHRTRSVFQCYAIVEEGMLLGRRGATDRGAARPRRWQSQGGSTT